MGPTDRSDGLGHLVAARHRVVGRLVSAGAAPEANWIPEAPFGTRLCLSTDRHLAEMIRAFHAQPGAKPAREDLDALALAVHLDELEA
jgi:hypothetical protein